MLQRSIESARATGIWTHHHTRSHQATLGLRDEGRRSGWQHALAGNGP
jgi:hypothetical protein